MASNYDGASALQTMLAQGLISQSFLNNLDKEKGEPTYQEVNSLSSISQGADVAFMAPQSDGVLLTLNLPQQTIKDLNALVFTNDNGVNLHLPSQFKGTVVFGNGNDSLDYKGSKPLEVNSGDGNDIITTGKGNDTVNGGNGNDSITTGNGKDIVRGDDGNDTINTGNGNDEIVGGAGADSVIAGNGKDTIVTGNGSDTVDAGNGNDLIIVGDNEASQPTNIIIDGGKGTDTLNLANNVYIEAGSVDTAAKTIALELSDGTQFNIVNVEKFVIDTNGDGNAETVGLIGLSDYLDSL